MGRVMVRERDRVYGPFRLGVYLALTNKKSQYES